jgi:hypothetical protein
MRRRLEDLEGRAELRLQRVPEHPSNTRRYMREHLDQVARLRRGELGPEEAAEVEAVSAAVKSRLASRLGNLGEGGA